MQVFFKKWANPVLFFCIIIVILNNKFTEKLWTSAGIELGSFEQKASTLITRPPTRPTVSAMLPCPQAPSFLSKHLGDSITIFATPKIESYIINLKYWSVFVHGKKRVLPYFVRRSMANLVFDCFGFDQHT